MVSLNDFIANLGPVEPSTELVDRLDEVRTLQSNVRRKAKGLASQIATARTPLARDTLAAHLEELGDRLEGLRAEETEVGSGTPLQTRCPCRSNSNRDAKT